MLFLGMADVILGMADIIFRNGGCYFSVNWRVLFFSEPDWNWRVLFLSELDWNWRVLFFSGLDCTENWRTVSCGV